MTLFKRFKFHQIVSGMSTFGVLFRYSVGRISFDFEINFYEDNHDNLSFQVINFNDKYPKTIYSELITR